MGVARHPRAEGPWATSGQDVLQDLSGCVQIFRANGSASLQVVEPPFTIKAEKLSLLGPNSSLSKADISNKSDELCCGIAYFSFPTIRGVYMASSAADNCAGAAESQKRRIPAPVCRWATPQCLPTAPGPRCWLRTHSIPPAAEEQQSVPLVGSRW